VSRSIAIQFHIEDVHRIRNFAEDLSRSLDRASEDLGRLPMAEADAATTHVRVTGIRKRNLRRCLAFVGRLLEQHYLAEQTVVAVDAAAQGD
jgi:hypothetical protein